MNPTVGATVWLVLLGSGLLWLVLLAWRRPVLIGPRAIMHWLLRSWPSRLAVLTLWAIAGWHVFCQRP